MEDSTVEEDVRAAFAAQNLTPERLGEAVYEQEVRAEVARLERGSKSSASMPNSGRTSATTERDADGFRRFGGMVGIGTALGKPAPTPEELAEAERNREELQALIAEDAACAYCLDARMIRPRPGVYVPCPECVTPEEQMRAAGIPRQFVSTTLATMDARLPGKAGAIRDAGRWNMTDSVAVFSRGAPGDDTYGTGKTMLACAMARRVIEARGRSVRFADVQDLLESFKQGIDAAQGEGTLEFLQGQVLSVDVLILDDVGAERPTEWAIDRVSHIIRDRYARGRTTIITTNFSSPEDVSQVFGGRVGSRLKSYRWIAMGGKDLRAREVSRG